MSLKAKVSAAVDKAFLAIGDLVVSATLSKRDISSYNFSTGAVVATSTTKTVKVFIESTTKPSEGAFQSSAMMKSDVKIDGYDTLTIGTTVYSITDFSDDGFVITMKLTREKL